MANLVVLSWLRDRKLSYQTLSAVLVVGSSALLLVGCGEQGARPVAAAVASPPTVEYITVRRVPEALVLELPGTVTPLRSAAINAPIGGEIRQLVEEGAQVTTSSTLAVLEAPGLPEQINAARASASAASRRRAGARIAVRQARSDTDLLSATLEQTLNAAVAERNRRQAALAEAEVQSKTEPVRLQAQVEAAEAHVRFLKSGEREQRIKQLEASLSVAQAELRVARTNFARMRALYMRGYVSRGDLETALLGQDRATANELQHLEELKLEKAGGHPEQIVEAERQAEMARQALAAAKGAQAVEQRRAELAQAEADVVKAHRNLETARRNRYPIARAEEDAAASDAEALRSEMELREVRRQLDRSVVQAPFAGQVVRRRARPGETVMLGAPLLELVDTATLQFEATVTDSDVASLQIGDSVAVRVTAAGQRILPGRISEIILASDPLRRNYRVRVALGSVQGLRAGMVGKAERRRASNAAGVRLPMAAFYRHFPTENRAELLVLDGDQTAVRKVRLGVQEGEKVEIVSGLRPGDRVIVSDAATLPVAARVQAREAPQP